MCVHSMGIKGHLTKWGTIDGVVGKKPCRELGHVGGALNVLRCVFCESKCKSKPNPNPSLNLNPSRNPILKYEIWNMKFETEMLNMNSCSFALQPNVLLRAFWLGPKVEWRRWWSWGICRSLENVPDIKVVRHWLEDGRAVLKAYMQAEQLFGIRTLAWNLVLRTRGSSQLTYSKLGSY